MVDIQSKEIIDKMSEDLKVQPAMQLPRELGKQILPVYNVNPERLIKVSALLSFSDATTGTIMTTNLTKDTFLVGINLAVAKSVLATSASSTVRGTLFGDAEQILTIIRYEPLTVGQFNRHINFFHPIKLERDTIIRATNSLGVASIDTSALVYFYETDPQ